MRKNDEWKMRKIQNQEKQIATLEEEIKFNFYTNPKNKKKLLYLSQEKIDYYMSFY